MNTKLPEAMVEKAGYAHMFATCTTEDIADVCWRDEKRRNEAKEWGEHILLESNVPAMLACVEELRWIVRNMPGVFPAATMKLRAFDKSFPQPAHGAA